MGYYNRLNEILASTLEDKNRSMEVNSLKETAKLAKIIIDNTPSITKESFEEYVSEPWKGRYKSFWDVTLAEQFSRERINGKCHHKQRHSAIGE